MTEQKFYRFECDSGSVGFKVFDLKLLNTCDTIDEALSDFISSCDEVRNNLILQASSLEEQIEQAKRLTKEYKDAEAMQLPEALYGVNDRFLLNKYDVEWFKPGIVRVIGGFLYTVHIRTDLSVIDQLASRGFFTTPELAIEAAKARIDRQLVRFKERNQDF